MSKNEDLIVRSATNADCDNVRDLVFGILIEYGLEPDRKGIDRDLDDIEASYLKSGGLFEIIEDQNGNLLGTVGLLPFDKKKIELRKMYFRPEIRGKGMGKITLKRMIESARKMGYEQLILETASVLKEAIGLYTKFGFQESQEKHVERCDRSYFLEIRQ